MRFLSNEVPWFVPVPNDARVAYRPAVNITSRLKSRERFEDYFHDSEMNHYYPQMADFCFKSHAVFVDCMVGTIEV